MAKEFKGVIYKATNVVNGKSYIGQTSNFEQRISHHIHSSHNDMIPDYDSPFHRAIRQYGEESFVWDVLCEVGGSTKEELRDKMNKYERGFIRYYKSFSDGYNALLGGTYGFSLNNITSIIDKEDDDGEKQ